MISNLPKYYRIATIDTLNDDLLSKRSNAITDIIESKDLNWLLDCVRLYLQKPVKSKNFEKELFFAIQKYDSLFLEEGSELEKKILAGAIIGESLIKREDKDRIAGSLKSGSFGLAKESILNSEIVSFAVEHLNKKAIDIREDKRTLKTLTKLPVFSKETPTVESLTEIVKNLLVYIKSAAALNEQQYGIMEDKIAVLEEESNIHWWLFRSYSSKRECLISELDAVEAIFILSSELNDLIRMLPPPNNIESFLKKIWSDVQDKPEKVSIKDAIEVLYNKLQDKIDDQEKKYEVYGNLIPLHLAFIKAKELEGNTAWTAPFEKLSGIKVDLKFNPVELSYQFLTELILFDLE
ncbi:GTPase-associated system all-helical protein GASH [Rhodocytophaga aerolata]|uniref:GTPase-associated system all-helical protein GASH n=1 Tax=Rhodocytophaga aerolata TaxID=455078 RepID=A0ABT8RGX5_9BACT|nr:GTPase-associated system all-helical protein GASH [Rhodocytophaga aerolata]MDO1451349.1 GTPase-associated system all-helical protein GASH [Rhodocytophaga aerolata]